MKKDMKQPKELQIGKYLHMNRVYVHGYCSHALIVHGCRAHAMCKIVENLYFCFFLPLFNPKPNLPLPYKTLFILEL